MNKQLLVIDKVNEIARKIYALMGYVVPKGYDFYEAFHPQEILCREIAILAWEEITGDTPDLDAEWLNE